MKDSGFINDLPKCRIFSKAEYIILNKPFFSPLNVEETIEFNKMAIFIEPENLYMRTYVLGSSKYWF